jgi:hypothetical protein
MESRGTLVLYALPPGESTECFNQRWKRGTKHLRKYLHRRSDAGESQGSAGLAAAAGITSPPDRLIRRKDLPTSLSILRKTCKLKRTCSKAIG